MCKVLDSNSDQFNEIIQNIKEQYLSKDNFPKLVLGTGLSMVYKLPGMSSLGKRLEEEFEKNDNVKVKKMWSGKQNDIIKEGLEKGLGSINNGENELVNYIKKYTAKFILNEEIRLFESILNSETGFKKLIAYLRDTCSVNNRILDIMTPNYDRIVEIVCDSLKINVITGFTGQNICYFNQELMKHPQKLYSTNKTFFVRLFKPHGSLNWLNIDGQIILTNDNKKLLQKSDLIEIITPGSSKYKAGLTIENFRCMREDFNEILENDSNYSLLIFGYGFNDEHFDIVLNSRFSDKRTLIISKEVKNEIIDKAMNNSKIVLIYQRESKNYIIYKMNKFVVDVELWDINKFSNIFIS